MTSYTMATSFMNREKDRLDSFWWTWSFNKRHELAKGGFYAMDDTGNLKCYFCHLTLDWWESNPTSQHLIRAPHCPFINGLTTSNIPLPRVRFENILTETEMSETYDYMDSVESMPIVVSPSAFTIPVRVNVPHFHNPVRPREYSLLPAPLYPIYNNMWARLNTFTNWPIGLSQKPSELSDAGFFYSQFNDKVTCFYCGHSLYKWEPEADPWSQHALWYKDCPYIRKRKGLAFVQSILRAEDDDESIATDLSQDSLDGTNDKIICKLCFERNIDVTLIPCGHCITCSTCLPSVTSCPICRLKFTDVMKVYF